jgi:hypothetical protein
MRSSCTMALAKSPGEVNRDIGRGLLAKMCQDVPGPISIRMTYER